MTILSRVAAFGVFRRRGPRNLLIELVVIAVLLGGGALAIYFAFRAPPIHNERALGGPNADVSQNARAQYEVDIAADPADPRVLLAGSTDELVDARVYTSTDGGRTWTSRQAPPPQRGPCGASHPAVAIGPGGLQVYASLVADTCQPPDPKLFVATRRGRDGRWTVRRIAPRRFAFDRRPSVAVDTRGSIYVAWTRRVGEIRTHQQTLVSRSDDGGRSWSSPVRLAGYSGVYSLDLAAGGPGDLFLAVADGKGRSLDLLRSTDGGRTWPTQRRLARLVEPYLVGCGAGAVLIPAQPQTCVGPTPIVVLTRDKVAVVYSDPTRAGTQGVFGVDAARTLASSGRPYRIGATNARADQFLPVGAYDRSTGDLWVCYYDTFGDSTRKKAWFTCTRSTDGGRTWATPVHAASAPSDETAIAADQLGYGEREGLVASRGVARPMWTDSRNLLEQGEEITTASIPARRVRR